MIIEAKLKKIVLGDEQYNILIKAIKYNSSLINDLSVESKTICDINDRLLDKLSKYQKEMNRMVFIIIFIKEN